MPAIKIYDKLTSLRYIFCIRYDYLQDQNSAGSLFKGPMFCTQYAFLPAFLRICAKCVEGQCRNLFSWSTLHAWIFFHLIFPCMNFFFVLRPPPHNFSNGPSLMVINNHDIFHVLSMLIHSAEVGRILILKRMWSP